MNQQRQWYIGLDGNTGVVTGVPDWFPERAGPFAEPPKRETPSIRQYRTEAGDWVTRVKTPWLVDGAVVARVYCRYVVNNRSGKLTVHTELLPGPL